MRYVFVLLLAILSMGGFAAKVQWNCITSTETVDGWLEFSYVNNENVRAVWVNLMMDYTVAFNGTTLHGAGSNLMFDGNWLKANVGDKIDATTTMNVGNYFYYGRFGPSGSVEPSYDVYDITLATDDRIYLAFCAMIFDQMSYAGTGEYLYGWLQLGLDEDGIPVVLGSALDLDGGPMNVGGGAYSIPEPSGGLLFVLGAAALGLRRRRVSPPYRQPPFRGPGGPLSLGGSLGSIRCWAVSCGAVRGMFGVKPRALNIACRDG